jgi:PST family polysaccharide transporter
MNHTWINFLPSFIRNRLDRRVSLQKALSNTGWLFTDHVIRMGVGLFVSVWVARYLGPEKYGVLSFAIAFVALFAAFSRLGLDSVVVRDIVCETFSANEILGTTFVLRLLGGVLSFLFAVSFMAHSRPEDNLTFWMVGIIAAGSIFQALDTIDFWFQSQVQSKYTVYARNSAFLLASIGKVGLILIEASLIAFACISFGEIFLSMIGLIIAYHVKGLTLRNWSAKYTRAKKLLRDSWSLILSSTFVIVNLNIDKVMVGEISGRNEVGLYSAAAALSGVWYFVPVAIGISIAPALTEENERNVSMYDAHLQRIYCFMTQITLMLAFPITFFSENIIDILFGSSYFSASQMLSVHIWSVLFIFHVSIRSRSLIIEGKEYFIAIFAVFTMIANIVLNLILIPPYGGIGAAYASLISWMISVLLLPCISRKTNKSIQMFFKSFNFLSLIKVP